MNERNRKRAPSPNWRKKSKRIRKPQLKAIAKEYDRRYEKGENREDIIERLAKRYGKSIRTIERWVEKGKKSLGEIASIHLYVQQKELEKINRLKSALKYFKNVLGEWVFRYAYSLSGKFPSQVNGRAAFYIQDFGTHLHELDIIFGGADWDWRKIRAPDRAKEQEIMALPVDVDDVRCCLETGLEQMAKTEKRINEFPEILSMVTDRAARIIRITDVIKQRILLLEEWKRQRENEGDDFGTIGISPNSYSIRVNLRLLGSWAVDVLIGIDEELQRLEYIGIDKYNG